MGNKIIILLLGIFIIIGVYSRYHKDASIVQTKTCDQDALLCPDDTSVGRNGLQCTFAACPNTTTSYTGKLIQQGDGFFLVIAAPLHTTAEVTYALPLELKVSNVVGQIVGQQVKVYGSFLVGNTFHVKNLEEVDTITATSAEIGIGEIKFVHGVRITLNSVVQDNRCPVDVTCIEAGAITANVTLKSDTDTETFNMPSDEVPHGFDSFNVAITGVKPSRIAAHAPDPKAYKVTFVVTENK